MLDARNEQEFNDLVGGAKKLLEQEPAVDEEAIKNLGDLVAMRESFVLYILCTVPGHRF